jgi:hypothetical protein
MHDPERTTFRRYHSDQEALAMVDGLIGEKLDAELMVNAPKW